MGRALGSSWVCPQLSSPEEQPAAPAAGLQPLAQRDLTAARKDTLLFQIVALPKRCQALGSAPAVWAYARYPHAGTHAALQGETQSR